MSFVMKQLGLFVQNAVKSMNIFHLIGWWF